MSDDYKDQHTNDVKDSNDQNQGLVIGTGILLTNNRTGIIRYIGAIKGEQGLWYGIELIAGAADKRGNNGVKAKKRYFFAPKGRAVFVRRDKIKEVLNKSTKSHLFNIVDPADSIENRNPQEWKTNDVCRWLAKIKALDAVTIFYVHGIVGASLLKLSPEDLEFRLGIKDKNLITQVFKAKEGLVARTAALPDLREDVALNCDEYKDLDRDVVKRPILQGLDARNRSQSSPARPKKRDSYSIPERQRGKIRNTNKARPNVKPQYPPTRGSLRLQKPVIGQPEYKTYKSSPIPSSLKIDEEREDRLTLSDCRSGAGSYLEENITVKQIEETPMSLWSSDYVAIWVDNLGGKEKKYGALFKEKQITGAVLAGIKADALKAIGVKEHSARQWIIASREVTVARQKVDELKID
jgi:hypothetical protein